MLSKRLRAEDGLQRESPTAKIGAVMYVVYFKTSDEGTDTI